MGAITRHLSGRGVAKQTFAILRKVREVNELVRTDSVAARSLIEVHPEVSFAAWRGEAMKFNKKRAEGRAERLELILGHFGQDAVTQVHDSLEGTKVPSDDIADAFAALWSAERYLCGQALSFPPQPVYDSDHIPMLIWY
jgi:predicted RNase H-like nuclease